MGSAAAVDMVGTSLCRLGAPFGDPRRDALAVPLVVGEVDDHRGQDQALLAALGATADRALQAVEQAVEALGVELPDLLGQPVHAFVGRTEGARAAAPGVVLAESLLGTSLRAEAD